MAGYSSYGDYKPGDNYNRPETSHSYMPEDHRISGGAGNHPGGVKRKNTSEQIANSSTKQKRKPLNKHRKRSRHPEHLKGKEIGMWYAEQAKKRNPRYFHIDAKGNTPDGQSTSTDYEKLIEERRKMREERKARKEQKQRAVVKMDARKERYVEDLLIQLKFANVGLGLFDCSESSDDSVMDWINAQVSDEEEYCKVSSSLGTGRFRKTSLSLSRALKTDHSLNEKYKLELEKNSHDLNYVYMMWFRQKLPVYDMKQDIVDLIESNQVVVLTGETGCGKTTQIPQYVLDYYIKNGKGSLCRIVCTQPRRISAISVAERVAQERAEVVGNGSIGYQIRLEKKLPRETGSILYCTTGIMLQWLHSDPELLAMSHIIIDEIHERTLESDFLLIILKDLLPKRPNLKVILMSATLNAEMFSNYFQNCPMLNIPGFTYPVQEYTLEYVFEVTKYFPPKTIPECLKSKWKKRTRKGKEEIRKYEQEEKERICSLAALKQKYSENTIKALEVYNEDIIDVDLITTLIKYICVTQPDGAILVFLPGWEQISRCHKLLTCDSYFGPRHHLILPLHSLMPTVNQTEIFNKPPSGIRKIILSTNIAETSITVDDIVYVIDCGKIKLSNFDVENNIATLKPEWVAIANSKQRRGRAGRTKPGICYHLYTEARKSKLLDYLPPEIMRIRLEVLCLKIKILKLGNIKTFLAKAMEAPNIKAVDLSIELLKTLHAFDKYENLTPLGYHLAQLPLDPHTGKMILFGAIFSCLDPILTVAASLSFKDAFVIPLGKEKQADAKKCELAGDTQSDHLMLIKAFSTWENIPSQRKHRFCDENFLSNSTLRMLSELKKDFARYLHELQFLHCSNLKHPDFNKNSNNKALLKAVICAGLYPNVAKVKNMLRKVNSRKPAILHTDEDGRVRFHPKSVNTQTRGFKSPWLVYYQKVRTTEVFIHDATVVSPYPLLFFGGKITTSLENGVEFVTVDDHIVFHCPKKIAHLIMGLRVELDKLLKYKISNPGVTNWDPNQREGAVLRTIVDLITHEEHDSDTGTVPVGDGDDNDNNDGEDYDNNNGDGDNDELIQIE